MLDLPDEVRHRAAKAACIVYWDEEPETWESMFRSEPKAWVAVVDAVAKVLAEHAHVERDEMATAAKAVEEERDQLRSAWRGLEYELLDLPPDIAALLPGSSFDRWFNEARRSVASAVTGADPSKPWPIPLPPEPPRDRVIEAVDAEGTVHATWFHVPGDVGWQVVGVDACRYLWEDIIDTAYSMSRYGPKDLTLRSVPAEGGAE